MATPPKKPLSVRRHAFVLEYLKDGKPKEAAIRAGYLASSAAQQASALLKMPEVAEEIARRREKVADRVELNVANTLEELRRIMLSDPADLFDSEGRLKGIHEIPKDTRHAIASFEVEEKFSGEGADRKVVGRLVKVKLWPKTAAIENSMKHLDLLAATKVDISGTILHQVQNMASGERVARAAALLQRTLDLKPSVVTVTLGPATPGK